MPGFVLAHVELIDTALPIVSLCRSGLGGFLWYIALKAVQLPLGSKNVIKLDNKKLAKKLGVTEQTVMQWKKKLAQKGIIKQCEDKSLYYVNQSLIYKGKIKGNENTSS